jgi:hypothetical protein
LPHSKINIHSTLSAYCKIIYTGIDKLCGVTNSELSREVQI